MKIPDCVEIPISGGKFCGGSLRVPLLSEWPKFVDIGGELYALKTQVRDCALTEIDDDVAYQHVRSWGVVEKALYYEAEKAKFFKLVEKAGEEMRE